MADNVIVCRSSSVIYPHLPLSPSHFQTSLSTLSTERINEIPLLGFLRERFSKSVKNIDRNDNIARLVKDIITVIMQKNAHSRLYVLEISQTAVVTFEMNSTFWTVPAKLNSSNFSKKNNASNESQRG